MFRLLFLYVLTGGLYDALRRRPNPPLRLAHLRVTGAHRAVQSARAEAHQQVIEAREIVRRARWDVRLVRLRLLVEDVQLWVSRVISRVPKPYA
jgi:hypothetical protein